MKVHKREVITDFDSGADILGDADSDNRKELAWQEAFRKKTFLFKDGQRLSEGNVDWSTFELILGTTKFSNEDRQNTLTMFRAFWRSLWPYIVNFTKGYLELQRSWHEIVEDQNEVLKEYADQNLELKCHREFMEMVNNELREAWEDFYRKRKSEIDDKIEKIRAEHELSQQNP